MDLKGLMEVGKIANKRVSDSEIRRKRILDAKAKMAEKRGENKEENATSEKLNRIGDSARPSRTPMRGVAAKRVAASQLARKQDSRAKSYFALRKRIKDELEETESTEEAIEAAVNVMQEEAVENPADVIAAVVEVLSDVMDTLPAEGGEAAEGGDEDYADEDFGGDEEVSDSLRKRQVVRRRSVADARKRMALRKRSVVADSRKRAELRKRVLDALARKRAAQKRIRDARMRKTVADSRVANKRLVRRG